MKPWYISTQANLSTAFHPQANVQAERIFQTLEDMLWACVIDFKGVTTREHPLDIAGVVVLGEDLDMPIEFSITN